MIHDIKSGHRSARVGCKELTLLCVALALSGCGKPPVRPPEKALVRTAVVESLDNVRSDGEASYLESVKFDHETDLNFKVGGIVVAIGPAANSERQER